MPTTHRTPPGPVAFVALSFALSWSIWVATWLLAGRPHSLGGVAMMVAIYAGSFGPGVSAAILSARAGRGALREWAKSFVRFRCDWRAYAALLPVPLAMLALTLALGYVPRPDKAHGLPPVAFYLTLFPVAIFNGLVGAFTGAGPLGEEGGWRGYLLPRMLERGKEWQAALIVGIVWAFWHLPVMAMFPDWRSGVPFAVYLPLYVVGVVGLSVVQTRIWLLGRGSLVPCIWLHGIVNAVGGVAFDQRIWSSRWSLNASTIHFDVAIWIAAAALLLLSRSPQPGARGAAPDDKG